MREEGKQLLPKIKLSSRSQVVLIGGQLRSKNHHSRISGLVASSASIRHPMLRSRIGNMRRLSAEFAVFILLCSSFICGEAAPGNFLRSDVSSTKMIVHLGSKHRKILQDPRTSTWVESKDAYVQKTDQGVDERKWEPKVNEKNEWIAVPKEDDKAAYQVKNAEREQVMVGKKNEASNEGLTVEKEQSKVEEKNGDWHQERKAESKQINVEKEARYQEPKADMERTQLEKKGEALHQDPKAQEEETKVDEKEKPEEEWKMVREEVGNVEPNADEKSENKRENNEREEKPVVRFEDEEWKVAIVDEKKIDKLEQKLADEKKGEPRVEESSKDSHVGETKEEPKRNEEERDEVEDRKEFKVEDRKEEPKIENIKIAPTVKEKNLEPIQDIEKEDKMAENDRRNVESKQVESKVQEHALKVDIEKEDKMAENDMRNVESKQVESKVQEHALKVQDEKEEDAVELKNESKKDKDGESSISSKIKEKPVKTKNMQETPSKFDEDYPDFLEELRNFPERFQKTAESVKDHISNSGLHEYSTQSKELFHQANQQIQESFTPLLGKDYAPFVAYLVSYGLLLLPLAIVGYLLDRIRTRYSLQKILLFVNIYLAAYFAALLAVALVLDTEPMNILMQYSSSSYIFLQLLQALGYLIYLLMNSADLISTCSKGRIAAKFSSVLQWVVVIAVGFHYYVTVFHRAMARKAPLTGPKIYALYSISFVFLCLFARIERGKKQYTPKEVDDTTDKKN